MGIPGGSDGKESACNAGDMGSIPGLGRSPREGNGYPIQLFFCLGNPMGRGAWQAIVHGGHKRVRQNLVSEQQRQPQMFTAALFTIASSWNQAKCPQTNEWIKKMYKYTMEYYSAINGKETGSFVVMWMNVESAT